MPLLSILVLTYNQHAYIAEAIESILSQKVDFEYEIVIGEDCSTDGTCEIVRNYCRLYPHLISAIFHSPNIGMMNNFISAFKACRGEYIAILEGDDYWTSPDKLQKQVDFLEAHPECCGCFHNVLVQHDNAPEKNHIFHTPALPKSTFTISDLLESNFIPTCSAVFKSNIIKNLPAWYNDCPMGDWPLHILNAEYGEYGYLSEVMGVYRIHDNGIWSHSGKTNILLRTIKALELMQVHLGKPYDRQIRKILAMQHYELALTLLANHQSNEARQAIIAAISAAPWYMKIWQRTTCKILPRMIRQLLKHTS